MTAQTAEVPSIVISNLVLLKDFLPPFQIGSTVRLKSGSPTMTVTAVQDGHVEVQWFEGDIAKQKIYPVGALNPVRFRKNVHV
jgi:uncharacterized protein YodC (DUF2158 family)